MGTRGQLDLVETFETARPPNPVFCHQEFLEKLNEHSRDSIGRRAAFLLQRLSVDVHRLHYKPTQGVNRGWRRSRLGGGHGCHFYAWWAPRSALPLKEYCEFDDAPEGSLFLRDIRHHDDHSLLTPQSFESHYMPVTVRDLRQEEYAPPPWTPHQVRFASARQAVRLLKGQPGSGKTTALLHAADLAGGQRNLYVTYSSNLAALARDYFDRFCSSEKRFDVMTFPGLVRQLLGSNAPITPEHETRQRFLRDLSPIARSLGPWTNSRTSLYDELHAHLAGDALPVAMGRFAACKQPRVSERNYRERRLRYLGESAATSALDAAARLEKLDSSTLCERYFPEIALAWRAVERVRSHAAKGDSNIDLALLNFDCIAVDECQDLTPLEAFLLVELTSRIRRERSRAIPLLMSGDEAQTVRPTDFEWGWLSDLLHSHLGTPSEYKLSANLRSPQGIAELVNRVWDLYSHIHKQERPSGTGLAEIEDDATDQILYCTATPGPELDELLISLSTREGLALITLGESVPAYVPEAARRAVLTVSEVKGLDFNSVCVLDAGHHLERVTRHDLRLRSDSDIEGLRRRLAIDQLRVALSRPTERLYWLDINPTEEIVRQSIRFLNGRDDETGIASCVPAALLTTLGEDELDSEERIQRCQADARQYLGVKPEMAWSRAQQAITLLGRPGSPAAVLDEAARNAAFLTLAEICFVLGLRNARLAPELGRPDLFYEAYRAAASANHLGLAAIIEAIGRVHRATGENRLHALFELAQIIPARKSDLQSWLLVELGFRVKAWVDELEAAIFNGNNAALLAKRLPPFYEALDVPDRSDRTQRVRQRAIQLLIKERQFVSALVILKDLPERQAKLEAVCHEGLGDFRSAAECHILTGNVKEALTCYRSIPDLTAALQLVREIGEHPAAESLQWMSELEDFVTKRPDKFTKVVTAAEKKLLEDMLERALGVKRRKPAARKTATKNSAVPQKRAPKTSAGR